MPTSTPCPGPVCWGCDPSRIGGAVRRLLRLQPAQHDCQGWIRYAHVAIVCSCPCRQGPATRTPTTPLDHGDIRPGRGCGR